MGLACPSNQCALTSAPHTTGQTDATGIGGMTGKLFINYRRGDDAGFALALYQRLEAEFSADNLFMDVEGHIKPGDDFVSVLRDQVASAEIMLVVIGPKWLDLFDAAAQQSHDFVGIEIRAALDLRKRVIPVLVGGAKMPLSEALPVAICALAYRNAVWLRPDRFVSDCQSLVVALKEQLSAEAFESASQDYQRVHAFSDNRSEEVQEIEVLARRLVRGSEIREDMLGSSITATVPTRELYARLSTWRKGVILGVSGFVVVMLASTGWWSFISSRTPIVKTISPTQSALQMSERTEGAASVAGISIDLSPPTSTVGVAPKSGDLLKQPDDVAHRARLLLESGQVKKARGILLAASDIGRADVLLILARSFDGNYLHTLSDPDALPNSAEARIWYRRWYEVASKEGTVPTTVNLERLLQSLE